jgi:hypothetical protein
MKTPLRALLLVLLLLVPGRAATINFAAAINNGFSLADGTDLPNGGLVRLGWFRNPATGATLTPAQIQALAGSPATLNASFVEVVATSIGVGVEPIQAAHFLTSATVNTGSLGVAGKQMALWVLNAPTLAAATQQAILYWDISDTTTNPDGTALAPGARWTFPAGEDGRNFDITDLTTGSATLAAGGRVVVGSFPTGTSDISDEPNFGLAAIVASPGGPSIATTTLSGGTAGTAYAQTLSATGGTAPYAWALQSGTLPGGLSLSTAGALSGTPNAGGSFNFTVRVTDATDAAATKSFTLAIATEQGVGGVTHQLFAQAGTDVPGAGGTSAAGIATIPVGAAWLDVGQPAIDDAGHVAYCAKWRAGKIRSYGIFRDDAFIVGVGDAAPDASGAVFSAFYDPLIGPNGSVAFLATLSGAGVTPANKWALCVFTANGAGQMIARTGGSAPETEGALFATFGDLAFVGSSAAPRLYFTATLRRGATALLAGTTSGVWLADPATSATPRLALRSGGSLTGFAFGEKIGSLTLFLPLAGSTGQGRGVTAGGGAHFLATLNTKRQALLKFDGVATTISALTGGNIGGTLIPTAQWKSVRLPSSAADGSVMSFYGTLVPKVAGVTAATSSGIFFGSGFGFEPLVRPGQTATTLGTATFASFLDPVMSPDGEAIAFSSFVKGNGVTPATNQVLWIADANAALSVLAREGTDAVGGGTWKAFTNLAFPGGGRGPLFLATLKTGGAITGANDSGAWAVDSTGALQRLFRKGDTIDGQVLKSFTLLKPSVGSKGATHSFNANGTVAWRAVFKKGAAILKTEIP